LRRRGFYSGIGAPAKAAIRARRRRRVFSLRAESSALTRILYVLSVTSRRASGRNGLGALSAPFITSIGHSFPCCHWRYAHPERSCTGGASSTKARLLAERQRLQNLAVAIRYLHAQFVSEVWCSSHFRPDIICEFSCFRYCIREVRKLLALFVPDQLYPVSYMEIVSGHFPLHRAECSTLRTVGWFSLVRKRTWIAQPSRADIHGCRRLPTIRTAVQRPSGPQCDGLSACNIGPDDRLAHRCPVASIRSGTVRGHRC